MLGYVESALKRFGVSLGCSPTHAPIRFYPINYGSKLAQQDTEDTTPPLSPAATKFLEEVIGVFLY